MLHIQCVKLIIVLAEAESRPKELMVKTARCLSISNKSYMPKTALYLLLSIANFFINGIAKNNHIIIDNLGQKFRMSNIMPPPSILIQMN